MRDTMTSDGVTAIPQVADHVVFRELDGEGVILDLQRGTYFGLDAVGTQIWQGIDRQDSIEAIVAAIVDGYDVDRLTADQDVRRLVAQLVDRGLLLQTGAHARPPL